MQRPIDVFRPAGSLLPIVIDSPHSGTHYPGDFGARVQPPLLRRGEDTHVDRLWGSAPDHGAVLVAARFPRAYIDPNRSLEDVDEALLDEPWPGRVVRSAKTELGVGLVWRLIGDEQPLYDRKLSVAEMTARIESCWRPYHAALGSALEEAAAQGGERWHLNVHSMPDDSYRRLKLPEKPLADVVLGNLDGATSDEATMRLLEDVFRAHGYSVAWNDPFKGVEIIRASGRPERGWHSVQIEVKRSLYMDADYAPHAGFERLRAAADAAIAALAVRARGSARSNAVGAGLLGA
jgi:N-formylglutamate deformylase